MRSAVHPCLAGAKACAVSIPVLVSTVVTCAVGALMPPLIGLALFTAGLVVCGAFMFGAVEPLAVRLLYGGSPLTAQDQQVLSPVLTVLSPHGLGPPLIDIWVRRGGPVTCVTATGRRSLLVTRGLLDGVNSGAISVDRASALLAGEAGLVRSGATRFDATLRFWTFPWFLLTEATVGVAWSVGVAPLVRVMWKARWIVTVIAVVQAGAAGQVALAVFVFVIGLASSLWPRWVRTWQARIAEIGDEAVARVGAPAPPAVRGPSLGSAQGSAAVGARSCAPSPRPHLNVVR